ncbi:MAG: hypothetical protein HY720_31145 [Planctomycetes bacterium]|nr:hypothetical protein [Planctomycetota bacterium]
MSLRSRVMFVLSIGLLMILAPEGSADTPIAIGQLADGKLSQDDAPLESGEYVEPWCGGGETPALPQQCNVGVDVLWRSSWVPSSDGAAGSGTVTPTEHDYDP